jgi:hypothetical protein
VAVTDATPVFVRENVAEAEMPGADAPTLYVPAVPLAVKMTEVATPDPLVTAVFTAPAKLPLGPLEGGVKVTLIPLRGLPFASLTVTTRGLANAVFVSALCGVPLVAVMDPATPVLVKVNVAGVEIPAAEAVTP